MLSDQVAQVRRFNRLVTQRAGALDDHFLGRDRPLGHSRVLFEIGPGGADLRDIRARLGLDSGYLSRIVQALEAEGLLTLAPAPDDDRVRHATLTPAGVAELEEMIQRSNEDAEAILGPLTETQRERLMAAMTELELLLRAAAVRIERVDPAAREARWCTPGTLRSSIADSPTGFDPS